MMGPDLVRLLLLRRLIWMSSRLDDTWEDCGLYKFLEAKKTMHVAYSREPRNPFGQTTRPWCVWLRLPGASAESASREKLGKSWSRVGVKELSCFLCF